MLYLDNAEIVDKESKRIEIDSSQNVYTEELIMDENISQSNKEIDIEPEIELHSSQALYTEELTENISQNYKDKSDQSSHDILNSQSTQDCPNLESTPDIANRKIKPLATIRKRKWGSSAKKLTSQKSISISTDLLNKILKDVKLANFEEVINEKRDDRTVVIEKIGKYMQPKIIINNTKADEIIEKDIEMENNVEDNVNSQDAPLASKRRVSIVTEQDSIIAMPGPSINRHKQSNILYITNLVKPFSFPQLKYLLQKTGRIVENGFWVNINKSTCYVKYETEDQAVVTRNSLHGITWPSSNPNRLLVDFCTEDDFEKAKAKNDMENVKVLALSCSMEAWLREKNMRTKAQMGTKCVRDVDRNENIRAHHRHDNKYQNDQPLQKKQLRSPENTLDPPQQPNRKEKQSPALLNNLCYKTETTPSIYWLPLSPDTIARKEKQRKQYIKEKERQRQKLQHKRCKR